MLINFTDISIFTGAWCQYQRYKKIPMSSLKSYGNLELVFKQLYDIFYEKGISEKKYFGSININRRLLVRILSDSVNLAFVGISG